MPLKVTFLDIENIHVMRASIAALREANSQAEVAASGWQQHVSQVMQGALDVAGALASGAAVLVHCSDGWDRTSQVCALAQLLLDPYYRTMAVINAVLTPFRRFFDAVLTLF